MKSSTLIYCLDALKIEKDTELYRKALELQKKDPIEEDSDEWTTAMKIIAHVNSHNIFTKSQLANFLTLSANGIEEKRRSSEMINNALYKMYMDVIENYESFSGSLKSNYPKIVVDVISIINQGIDTKGNKVSGIWKYYQSRKQQSTAAAAIHKEKIEPQRRELVESLSQITNRDRKELEESLAKLEGSDLNKISELSSNYGKLQHYNKLITTKEQLKNEIKREVGKELRSHDLVRVTYSIRRAKVYIENILDNKFTPDSSHGINHIKHNLEYGYRLLNLIKLPERRRQRQH